MQGRALADGAVEGRTTRDQVQGHDKDSERSEQGKLEGKVKDVAERRNDRKKHIVYGLV